MNSKELAALLQDGAEPVGTLFAKLVEDGDALVRARNAKAPESIRSCYLEQNQKWVSAAKKTGVVGEHLFMDFLTDHPRLRHVVNYKKPPTMSEQFQIRAKEIQAVRAEEEKTLSLIVEKYVQLIHDLQKRDQEQGVAGVDVNTAAGLAQGYLSSLMITVDILSGPADLDYIITLLMQAHDAAMLRVPGLLTRERKYVVNTVIALNREKLATTDWGVNLVLAHRMLAKHV